MILDRKVTGGDLAAQYGNLRLELLKLLGAEGQSHASKDADFERKAKALLNPAPSPPVPAPSSPAPAPKSVAPKSVAKVVTKCACGATISVGETECSSCAFHRGDEDAQERAAAEAKAENEVAVQTGTVDLSHMDLREIVAELYRRRTGPAGVFPNGTWMAIGNPGNSAEWPHMVGMKLSGTLEVDVKILLIRESGVACRKIEYISSRTPMHVIDAPAGYEGPKPGDGDGKKEITSGEVKVAKPAPTKKAVEINGEIKPAKGVIGSPRTPRTPGEPSTKLIVYRKWKETKASPDQLHKEVGGKVQLGTIKSWIGQWRNNKALPSGAGA
jgi:hypothetical protein